MCACVCLYLHVVRSRDSDTEKERHRERTAMPRAHTDGLQGQGWLSLRFRDGTTKQLLSKTSLPFSKRLSASKLRYRPPLKSHTSDVVGQLPGHRHAGILLAHSVARVT